MEVRHITFSEREIWNNFLAQSSECPILQSFEWGELKEKFGWEPFRIAVEEQGKIIAGISILKRKIPYIGCSMFYAPRGPVFNISHQHDPAAIHVRKFSEKKRHKSCTQGRDRDRPGIQSHAVQFRRHSRPGDCECLDEIRATEIDGKNGRQSKNDPFFCGRRFRRLLRKLWHPDLHCSHEILI